MNLFDEPQEAQLAEIASLWGVPLSKPTRKRFIAHPAARWAAAILASTLLLFPAGLLIAWNAKTEQLRRLGSSYEYDRVTQEAASLGAQADVIVAAAAVASMFVSIYVTMLIYYTLHETRRLADDTALIGKAQTRGYLVVRAAYFRAGRRGQVFFELEVENIGQSHLHQIELSVQTGERHATAESNEVTQTNGDIVKRAFSMPLQRSGVEVLRLELNYSEYLWDVVVRDDSRGNTFGGFWLFAEGEISYVTHFNEPVPIPFAFASFGPFNGNSLSRCVAKWPSMDKFV